MSEKKNNPLARHTPSSDETISQPIDVPELLNKYGTYNIQPTADSDNPFPAIAQGLPTEERHNGE